LNSEGAAVPVVEPAVEVSGAEPAFEVAVWNGVAPEATDPNNGFGAAPPVLAFGFWKLKAGAGAFAAGAG